MKFPIAFENRMRALLGDAYDAFEASYDKPSKVGLRVNTLKISVADFLNTFPYALSPVPWTEDGFYYDANDPVSKHPYFYAGLYYIQEPSAMAPAALLKPSAHSVALDLCAAPGGKSMQLANAMKDQGLLVSNDINETRIKAVLRNAERFGLKNIVILNESPQNIARIIGPVFDAILIDAPCSGEGMFKKDPKAFKAWEDFGPERCALMQSEILETLENLIKDQTKVIYSTCTFAKEENEFQMAHLISKVPALKAEPIESDVLSTEGHFARIWPHLHDGEGHFMCALRATGEKSPPTHVKTPENKPLPNAFEVFLKTHLKNPAVLSGDVECVKDKLYLRPDTRFALKGLRVVREGLLLGEMKKERFIPSQALALFLKSDCFHPILDFDSGAPETLKYLKGETVHSDVSTTGLHLVCVDGYPLGWGKMVNGTLKNMYPPSWRML